MAEPTNGRPPRRAVAGALLAGLFLLLPGLMLAPVWRLGGLGASEDDILYYYPSRQFLHDTIAAGHAPWLNPWTGLGRPFLADPQSALFYPPTWLCVALPVEWAYPLLLWLHYSFATWGAYRLARSLPMGRGAALLSAIAFAYGGFMLAHRAHFTMQAAAAWTPWVLLAIRRFVAGPPVGERRGAVRLIAATAAILLQCLAGHTQMAAITALGSLVVVAADRRTARLAATAVEASPPYRAHALLRWMLPWMCAAGLFAVQWMPTYEYLRLCTRVERGFAGFVENSWSPASIVTLTLPMFFGQRTPNFFGSEWWGPSHQVEQFAYLGILPLLLAAAALRDELRGAARVRPWLWLLVFAALLALGRYGPIAPLLYFLPGSSLFRVPARALVLVQLALALLAGVGLDALAGELNRAAARLRFVVQNWTRRPLRIGALLIAAPLLATLVALPMLDEAHRAAALHALRPWNPAVLVPIAVVAASLTVLRGAARWPDGRRWLWVIPILAAADLAIIGWTIDVPAGARSGAELRAPRETGALLEDVRDSGERMWLVCGRMGGKPGEYVDSVGKAAANTNVLRGVESLTDYGPLQPRGLVRALGLEPWGESLRAPERLADTEWMRRYNVGWVLLCDERADAPSECEPAGTTTQGWRMFHFSRAGGLAFFDDTAALGAIRSQRAGPSIVNTWIDLPEAKTGAREGETDDAGEIEDAPDGMRDGSVEIVLSQLALPGWRATLAGRDLPTVATRDGLLGVRVPAGSSGRIIWRYFPPGLTAGAVISLLTALVLAVLWFRADSAARE